MEDDRPIRVLLDGFNMSLEEGTGVATYARNLSYGLRELGHEVHVLYGVRAPGRHRLMREIAFFDAQRMGGMRWWFWSDLTSETALSVYGALRGAIAQPLDLSGAVIRTPFQAKLPYYDKLWNARDLFTRADKHFNFYRSLFQVSVSQHLDVAHWTFPLPLRARGMKNIYTIHDLVPLRLPYTTLDIKRRYYRKLRLICRRADHIVTVSETSKRDIVNLLGIEESRVTNTYQAVEIPDKYRNKTEDVVKREVEGTFNIPYKGYMLFFGAIEPKKNVGRLIEGFLASKVETPLLIVGKLAWKSDKEMQILNEDVVRYLEQIDSLTVTRHRVRRVDYAPFPLLVSLIRGAKAVLFPSLYEGFGLPALEAMTLGTPVLTSTGGSMPEVAGDAALTVDPFDPAQIAEGIRALDSNAELRGDLSFRGLERARLFTAEKYQARMAALYRRVLQDTAGVGVNIASGLVTSPSHAQAIRRSEL